MAVALAAATLSDPLNAQLKAAARQQAADYLQQHTGTTADTLYAYAHSADTGTDPYADREANKRAVTPRLTYILPRTGRDAELAVPKGAEVLLETRQPYLTAEQRRDVLRSTALPAGYPLLDGPEQWGRLNLFAAADGYGSFDGDVEVTLDAAAGGFHAADVWRNDIGGPGRLTKSGTGSLTLTGANRFSGGVRVLAGTLAAGSLTALGGGDVEVGGGTLRLTRPARIRGDYRQIAGTLAAPMHGSGVPALAVAGAAEIGRGSVLELTVDEACDVVPVLRARRLRGRFAAITVRTGGYRATPIYTETALFVRLTRA
jgi:autotransporter-associated beta strand protein